MIITDRRVYTTAKQAQDYLLCSDCEDRFRVNGEDWVLAYFYRGRGRGFKLREILLQQTSLFIDGNRQLYACAGVPNLDMDKMIYFAASFFWRTAVHVWKRDERTITIDLGKYAEPLRRFLLGEIPFPEGMALHTWISSFDGDLLAKLHLPEARRIEGFHTYQFAIPGIHFRLMVASHMPQRWFEWSTAPGPHRLVGIMPELDQREFLDMSQRYQRVASLSK
jgi:hypothetical protein